jgi:hypothetical protein
LNRPFTLRGALKKEEAALSRVGAEVGATETREGIPYTGMALPVDALRGPRRFKGSRVTSEEGFSDTGGDTSVFTSFSKSSEGHFSNVPAELNEALSSASSGVASSAD